MHKTCMLREHQITWITIAFGLRAKLRSCLTRRANGNRALSNWGETSSMSAINQTRGETRDLEHFSAACLYPCGRWFGGFDASFELSNWKYARIKNLLTSGFSEEGPWLPPPHKTIEFSETLLLWVADTNWRFAALGVIHFVLWFSEGLMQPYQIAAYPFYRLCKIKPKVQESISVPISLFKKL